EKHAAPTVSQLAGHDGPTFERPIRIRAGFTSRCEHAAILVGPFGRCPESQPCITVFFQYNVRIGYGSERRPDVNSVAVRIQLRNGNTPIFSHDNGLMAVIKDDMIVYRFETGVLVILENFGELHKTHRPFFIPYIP